ncbi:MAG: CRTAC1 family protein, partial [Myxococcota bacterium]
FFARCAADPDYALITGGAGAGGGTGLYVQEDGALVDAGGRLPADLRDGFSFQGAWLDADGDEDLDVYLVNDFGAWIDPNALLRNQAGAFVQDAACGCELASSGMGAAVADFDENHVPDLFVTDIGSPTLLLGDGAGAWYDATLARKAEVPFAPDHQSAWGAAPIDLDLDGHVDVAATYGPIEFWYPLLDVGDADGNVARASMEQRDVFLRNRGGVYFSEDATRVGFDDTRVGRSVAVGDLDRDGRPDLVTAGWELTGEPFLRVSLAEGGCGTGVTLRGAAEDVGARVETVVAGETRVGWLLPSTTFSQSAPELIVGLGGHETAERITVRWPGGAEESWADVDAGAVIDL